MLLGVQCTDFYVSLNFPPPPHSDWSKAQDGFCSDASLTLKAFKMPTTNSLSEAILNLVLTANFLALAYKPAQVLVSLIAVTSMCLSNFFI